MKKKVTWKDIKIRLMISFIAIFFLFLLLCFKGRLANEYNKFILLASIGIFIVLISHNLNFIFEKSDDILYQISDFFVVLLVAFLLFQTFFSFGYFRASVVGKSMLPTLVNSQNVIVRANNKVSRGDVVVLYVDKDINSLSYGIHDEEIIIKRVIGIGGDTVYCENNKVYVNGILVEEAYLDSDEYTSSFILSDVLSRNKIELNGDIIPEGYYLVLGDNRDDSNDSRYLGLFSKDQILGVAKYKMKDTIFNWEQIK